LRNPSAVNAVRQSSVQGLKKPHMDFALVKFIKVIYIVKYVSRLVLVAPGILARTALVRHALDTSKEGTKSAWWNRVELRGHFGGSRARQILHKGSWKTTMRKCSREPTIPQPNDPNIIQAPPSPASKRRARLQVRVRCCFQ